MADHASQQVAIAAGIKTSTEFPLTSDVIETYGTAEARLFVEITARADPAAALQVEVLVASRSDGTFAVHEDFKTAQNVTQLQGYTWHIPGAYPYIKIRIIRTDAGVGDITLADTVLVKFVRI